MASRKNKPDWIAALEAFFLRALIRWPKVLPFGMRRGFMAWVMAWIIAPIAGYRSRIAANLAHVCPELPRKEVRRLQRAVPANVGRTLTEMAAGREFVEMMKDEPITGPGFEEMDAYKRVGRPIVMVTGHFGNFDAMRGALVLRGYSVGGVYRPLNHPVLEKTFYEMMTGISEPVFPRGRAGLGRMIRHLRSGHQVAIIHDQYVNRGAPMTFFGKPAPTALSAAELALKYDALLVPVYGIRRAGGGFDLIVEKPIPHSDAATMTQAANDSLEARVRANMDQWLWIHRRWKPDRQARRAARQRKAAAARTSP